MAKGSFKPKSGAGSSPQQMFVRLHPDLLVRIKTAAAEHGLSANQFAVQALEYALDNMEDQP